MKTTLKFLLFLAAAVLLALTPLAAQPALAAGPGPSDPAKQGPVPGPQDQLVLGGVYTLKSGDTLEGSLFVLGGMAKVEDDATVEGDVMVLGGSLTVDGTVEGDINVLGGLVSLGETGVVEGDVNTLSGSLQQADGAKVEGSVNQDVPGVYPFVFSKGFTLPVAPQAPTAPSVPAAPTVGQMQLLGMSLNPLWDLLWFMFQAFLWAALAVVVTLFAPNAIERTGQAGVNRAPAAGGIGCLTVLVAPLAIVVLVITLCGIPIALVLAALVALAWAFGVVALGLETGKRLAMALGQDWAPAASAGLGTFALALVMGGLALVPCIGWLGPAVIGMVGLGAALLTRFGTRPYPPDAANAYMPVTPAAPYAAAPVAPYMDAAVADYPPQTEPDSTQPLDQ